MSDSRFCQSKNKSSDKNMHLFCFFKGSTKGLFEVGTIEKSYERKVYTINLPNVFLMKDYILKIGDYLQLNGVLCEIIKAEYETTKEENKYKWSLVVSTTFELVENTNLKEGCKISLGIMAIKDDNAQFFIHPSTTKQAKCINTQETLGSHGQAVMRFDFSCAKGDIHQNHHVGIDGSAFYVKSAEENEEIINFTIFSGQGSWTNTRLNKNDTKIGDLVNINVAKIDSTPEATYPNKHLSLSKT